MKRVVITGLGLLSSIGNNKEDTWNNLINCESGIKKITHFNTEGLTCDIAGFISHNKSDRFYYDNSIHLDTKDIKRNDRFIQYGIAASKMAVDDSGISDVSRNTLIDFLDKNKKELSRYIILGHTDTKGTSDYNINLSLKRAQAVKEILINQGISDNSISLLGKGENELAVNTPDETKHPANRRAEVKIIN